MDREDHYRADVCLMYWNIVHFILTHLNRQDEVFRNIINCSVIIKILCHIEGEITNKMNFIKVNGLFTIRSIEY